MSADDLPRLRSLLAAAVRLQALPLSELERRLGMGRGQLGRMLNGRTEIRLRRLLELLDAIGLPPGAFFHQVFPAAAGSPGAPTAGAAEAHAGETPEQIRDHLHEMIGLPPPRRAGGGSAPPGPRTPLAPLSDAELDERLDDAFARFWGPDPKQEK